MASSAGADFELTNLAGPAASISSVSGTPQTALLGLPFAAALVVHVSDAEGNPRIGQEVTFAAPASGASAELSASSAMTDANGDASVTRDRQCTGGRLRGDGECRRTRTRRRRSRLSNSVDAADRIFVDGFETTP